jgi:hypothetical protein
MAELALSLTVAYAAAAAFFLTLGAIRPLRTAALLALGGAALASPLLIPGEPPLRLAAALNAIAVAVKLYDLHLDPGRAARFKFPSYLAYLPNCLDLVPRKNPPPKVNTRQDALRLAAGLQLAGFGAVLTAVAFRVRWASFPFLFEHVMKVTAVYLAVAGAGLAAAAGWRLAGVAALDPMHHPELAPTPAEFWRRWNRPAQQFFYEDMFKPCGGLRAPVRGTLMTFAVSAAIHEYVFGASTGRVQGCQAAFFLLQGLATAVTLRVRPTGLLRVTLTALTLAFMLTSSVLFFQSVDDVVPFYDARRAFPGPTELFGRAETAAPSPSPRGRGTDAPDGTLGAMRRGEHDRHEGRDVAECLRCAPCGRCGTRDMMMNPP